MPPLAAHTEPVSQIPAHFIWALQMAQQNYQRGKKSYLFCKDEEDGKLMDELLWQLEPAQFVPHSLPGEGSAYGAAVAVIWQAPKDRRPLLINLSETVPVWAGNVALILDFVPVAEEQKELARERYKQYRQQGFKLETEQMPAREHLEPMS